MEWIKIFSVMGCKIIFLSQEGDYILLDDLSRNVPNQLILPILIKNRNSLTIEYKVGNFPEPNVFSKYLTIPYLMDNL